MMVKDAGWEIYSHPNYFYQINKCDSARNSSKIKMNATTGNKKLTFCSITIKQRKIVKFLH